MIRRIFLLAMVCVAVGNVGCTWCRNLFGGDRRCDAPPPAYYNAQPMVSAPVQYVPTPGTCNTPK